MTEIFTNALTVVTPLHSVVWNLFLAVIPVVVAFSIVRLSRLHSMRSGRGIFMMLPILFVWLIFLPNTCYLMSEWRHFINNIAGSPLIQQVHQNNRNAVLAMLAATAFYCVYTGCGMLCFFLAVWPLDHRFKMVLGKFRMLFGATVFLLCSLGVYLGLVERYNSWDPAKLSRLKAIIGDVSTVLRHPVLVGLILLYGAMLWISYAVFDVWMDGLIFRVAAVRRRTRLGDA